MIFEGVEPVGGFAISCLVSGGGNDLFKYRCVGNLSLTVGGKSEFILWFRIDVRGAY